ncbi:MAG: isochorismate synthase [Sedimenticola sp.]
MTDIQHIEQTIQQLLQEVPPKAGRRVSVTLPLTGINLDSLPQTGDQRYFWMRPDKGVQWLGLGVSWQCGKPGNGHLAALAEDAETLGASIDHIDPEGCGSAPRLSLVSQDDGGLLTLPLVQLQFSPSGNLVTVSPDPDRPDSWRATLDQLRSAFDTPAEPPPPPPTLTLVDQAPQAPVWLRLAEQAIGELNNDHLDKLVLGRRITLTAQRKLSPEELIRTLGTRHSRSTLFAADRENGCWVGASPEILIDLQGEHFYSEAVAGTVRRDAYESVDNELGEWLLRDPKNRHEHQLVVDSLVDVLEPLSAELETGEQPVLLKLRGLQHLHTPVSGRLKRPLHPLRIAHQLHPTPAVGGTPKQAAVEWLESNEPLDRRWFTGLAGWIDTAGNGSLCVVLRCAHLQQERVDLYAGAGLVADSDSLAEWEETELKLDNMIKALQDA